jgi:Mn-dependent DtxR family transcriptional regulator
MTKKSAEKIITILHTIPTKVGWFPKIEDIAKKLNVPKYKASRILKELNELGMLSRTGNWYGFIDPIGKAILTPIKDIHVNTKQAKDYIDAITEANKHD